MCSVVIIAHYFPFVNKKIKIAAVINGGYFKRGSDP